MKRVVLVVLVLAGCSESPNRQEFTNEQLALLQLHERVGQLSAQLGVQPTMPDLTPLSDRVAALEARAAVMEATMAKLSAAKKVPHLVSRDTGVDYGVSVDGALAAWSSELAAVVDYSPPMAIAFTEPNCKGSVLLNAAYPAVSKFPRYAFAPDGRLFRATSTNRENHLDGSVMETDGSCSNQPNVYGFPSIEAPKSTPMVHVDDLAIELR